MAITSSCRRWASPCPCGCGRWCGCAGRAPATACDGASPDRRPVHQPLDVDRDLATEVAFDHVVAVNRFANLQNFRIRQLRDPPLGRDVHLLDNLLGLLAPDAVDILKRDDHALVGRNINACDASHSPSPFRRRPTCKVESRGNRLDVRWRPALAENRERTQKVPCARKRRRDPERLRDARDVEPNLRLSREKWSWAGASGSKVIAAAAWRAGRNRSRRRRGRFLRRPSGCYPSQYRPIPSIAAPSKRNHWRPALRSPQRSSP